MKATLRKTNFHNYRQTVFGAPQAPLAVVVVCFIGAIVASFVKRQKDITSREGL
jgi:hypothetical protein